MKGCLCDSPNIKIKNTHYKNMNLNLILMKDNEGPGIIILEDSMAIGCFDIRYCPVCGKDLKETIK